MNNMTNISPTKRNQVMLRPQNLAVLLTGVSTRSSVFRSVIVGHAVIKPGAELL